MLFNSVDFAIFMPLVFGFYWFVANRSLRLQNGLVLAASYVFYGWWDWRFLSLIVISSAVDFIAGLLLYRARSQASRILLLVLSLSVNLGLLGFFKYFNFFVDSLVAAFANAGVDLHLSTLRIILPVGISFYTFQTLSYTIDVYRRQIMPTRDPIAFFAFVAFFPQLVAGPIERAANLLPQFQRARRFDPAEAVDGLRQILYGLFKKVVIADGVAGFVDHAFGSYQTLDGASLAAAAICFTFQIYCDFSGYSDIAIGTGRLLGFRLMRNFAFPFFSRDIAEVWRRWHISLSTWFRDYLFIPLGGSRGGKWLTVRNIFITFTVSGLWHGANWTFLFWGALNALYYVPLLVLDRQRDHTGPVVAEGRLLPSPKQGLQMLVTFTLFAFSFIFFRSSSLGDAFGYLRGMFSSSLLGVPEEGKQALLWLLVFTVYEWLNRSRAHAFQLDRVPAPARWCLYWAVSLVVLARLQGEVAFIYFQF